MDGLGFWPRFVVAVLAVWRVTHLLAREDGPLDLIYRLRARLGNRALGKAIDCFHCLSLWMAAPLAWFVAERWLDRVVIWLALSGAACLLEAGTASPVVMHPLPERSEEEVTHAVLRSEASVAGSRASADGNPRAAG